MTIGPLLIAVATAGEAAAETQHLAPRLDASLAQLLPGRTLAEVKSRLGKGLIEIEPSGNAGPRTVYLIVTVNEGARSASQRVNCELDARGRLTRCVNSGPRYQTQHIAEADWERIAKGTSQQAVYRTIGPASDPVFGPLPGYDAALEYTVALRKPTPYFSSCAGRILIKKSVVVAKELMCE